MQNRLFQRTNKSTVKDDPYQSSVKLINFMVYTIHTRLKTKKFEFTTYTMTFLWAMVLLVTEDIKNNSRFECHLM